MDIYIVFKEEIWIYVVKFARGYLIIIRRFPVVKTHMGMSVYVSTL